MQQTSKNLQDVGESSFSLFESHPSFMGVVHGSTHLKMETDTIHYGYTDLGT